MMEEEVSLSTAPAQLK